MMRRRQGGAALLEALLAAVLLAIGLLGTVGLQARAYSALSDAGMRAEATIATEKLLGMMNNDVSNILSYAVAEGDDGGAAVAPWMAETAAAIPGAAISVAITQENRRYRVDARIRWTRKSAGVENQHVLTSYVSY